MSVRALSVIFENYPRGGSEMLVALCLADWSNDDGESLHPSMRSIARKARLSAKQARRIVHNILLAGFLEVVGNHGGGDPGDTRHYRLRLDLIAGTPRAAGSRTSPVGGRTPADGRAPMEGRNPSHGRPPTPPAGGSLTVIEPSRTVMRKSSHLRKRDPSSLEASFDLFWLAYPKRRDKAKARKAWDKLAPTDDLVARIMEHVRASAESHDWRKEGGQFIPFPSSYLNGRRWEDELFATGQQARRVAL